MPVSRIIPTLHDLYEKARCPKDRWSHNHVGTMGSDQGFLVPSNFSSTWHQHLLVIAALHVARMPTPQYHAMLFGVAWLVCLRPLLPFAGPSAYEHWRWICHLAVLGSLRGCPQTHITSTKRRSPEVVSGELRRKANSTRRPLAPTCHRKGVGIIVVNMAILTGLPTSLDPTPFARSKGKRRNARRGRFAGGAGVGRARGERRAKGERASGRAARERHAGGGRDEGGRDERGRDEGERGRASGARAAGEVRASGARAGERASGARAGGRRASDGRSAGERRASGSDRFWPNLVSTEFGPISAKCRCDSV